MSLLDTVLSKLKTGDSEDDVLSFLDSLSWNEIRAMKAKLVTDTGSNAGEGGRTKPELHRTIVKLGQAYLAGRGGSSLQKKQKVADEKDEKRDERRDDKKVTTAVAPAVPASDSSTSAPSPAAAASAAVAAVAASSANALSRSASMADFPLSSDSNFVPPAHAYDVDCSRPLPPNDRTVPLLKSMALQPFSFAFGVASNDFSVSVFDSCCVSDRPKKKQPVTEAELSVLGTALLLNTRLRKIALPFSGLGDKDLNALFGPCIEFGHRLGLTTLDLRHNGLTKNSAATVASAVGLCPNLQRLWLDENDLKEAGLIAVIKAVPPSLLTLSMTRCTDRVVAAIASELKGIPNLFDLCLTNGTISDAGITKLMQAYIALGPQAHLARLDVRGNAITSKSAPVFVEALRRIGSLWWIQDDDAPNGRVSAVRETTREKFRSMFPNRHPAAELQMLVSNDHQFASVTSQRLQELVCACLSMGVDVAAPTSVGALSILQCAASFFGDGRVMQLLLATENGPEAANKSDERGRGLLMQVPSMSPENLRLLLEAGMRPGLCANGIPFLVGLATYAWTKGQAKDVRGWVYRLKLLLLLDNAMVNACDSDGETALSVLSRSGYAEVVDLLLESGADVKSRDKSFQNTPMHWACKYGQPNTVRALMRRSDLTVRNAAGETPLDLAKKHACAQVELELNVYLRNQQKK